MKRSISGFKNAAWILLVLACLVPSGIWAVDVDAGLVLPGVEQPAVASEITDAAAPEMAAVADVPAPAEARNKDKATVMSLLDIIKKGGIVGYLIILLSVVSLGLILDYSLTIRKTKILPPKDIASLKEMIEKGHIADPEDGESSRGSFLKKVTMAGLRETGLGYAAMIKAMEDASEALTSGIARKIEHLNVIGNISPMMGLLGTVIGMLRCFNEIANVAGAIEPKQLAGGIFEALVTTCMGLIVAIPSLYCYAVFKNRIDEYTGEAALLAESLVSPYKEK